MAPCFFSTLPSAQSSISACLIAAMPPAAFSALRCTSMQPPAAPAIFLFGSLTQAKG